MKPAPRMSRRERAFLRQLFELRVQPRKAMLDLEHAVRKFSAQRHAENADGEPMPREILERAARLQKDVEAARARTAKPIDGITLARTDTNSRHAASYHQRAEGRLDSLPTVCREQTSQQHLDPSQFLDLVREGAVDLNAGNHLGQTEYKTAFSRTGYAYLSGERAQPWNRTVFGFRTGFSLPEPGKRYTVDVYSFIDMSFIWPDGYLEALSFGKASWGEVLANTCLDVKVDNTAYRDGGYTLLEGVSPRGNWREGDIGIYNPSNQACSKEMHLRFEVANPADRNSIVYVYETAEFIAQRHHRADRCNAVIWGTCRWDPLDVRITTHC